LRPPSGFSGSLNGGQEQRYQNSNDCNHNEQLDERKTLTTFHDETPLN
jgi:hypothetical protein